MSQCLHCSKPCVDQAVFCEICQEQARELFQQQQPEQFPFSAEFSPLTPATFSPDEEDGTPLGAITIPFEPSDSFVEVSALSSNSGLSSTDQAVSRLSAAARWIEAEEAGESRLKRASRLTPLRDISADIQRASTPHPLQKRQTDFDTLPGSGAVPASNGHATADWHWFEDEDENEEKEVDAWANVTDPLLARNRPSFDEAAPIEEADIRRVQLEEQATLIYPAHQPGKRRFSRWHTAFASMVILAVVALVVDGLLLSFAFHQAGHSNTPQAGPPTLLLSSNIANPGDKISLSLLHFPSATTVALTHDVQETLLVASSLSTLETSSNGSASGDFMVSTSWGPGFHLIVAEDIKTRYTASAMLQIAGEGPSRPPHLLVDDSSLNLGDAVQGANTIQPLELRNSGSGSISWSASSDKPWLLVAPVQGVFSTGQSISIAAQRSNLPPGDYKGTITVFSTVGAAQSIQVSMKVSALPPNAGPMISLTPPLLAFTTTDGSSLSNMQMVTLSNPGQQALDWFLNIGPTTPSTIQAQGTAQDGTNLVNQATWLSTDVRAGRLAPGQSVPIRVTVRGQNLLPGAYMATLTFSSTQKMGAYDNPQVMNVALTVQPRCGLLTSSGVLDFTAVVGQSNPSNHALGLSTTSSCSNETLSWHALAAAPWLAISPQSGELKGASTSSGVTSIGVNTAGMKAGEYTGLVTFQAGKSTQTVVVRLNLQPHPSALEPILGVSPLSLTFSTIQGQASPAGQMATITNNGGGTLKWQTSVIQLGTNWLSVVPSGGTVAPGATAQVTVSVATTSLTPGSYTGQVALSATDGRGAPASGSPQSITVSLTVQPPCLLAQPSASALLFTATAGSANPLPQTVNLASSGSCSWPVQWRTTVSPSAPWLSLSAPTGSLTTLAPQGSISVKVNTKGLQPGTYSTQVTINAVDAAGTPANGSPQTFSVTLTVQQPCTLQALPAQIVFNAVAGQAAPEQTLNLGSTGSCNGGISWTALGDANSSSWLSLSATAGTDTGSNSAITLNASASQLSPGTYTGQITVSANNNGMVLQNSPQVVKVTLQVSGYNISGTALACNGPTPTCTTSQGLAGANISLVNSDNVTIATVTADSAGNFTLTNVPPGNYTISVSGSINAVNYSGTVTVTVNSSLTSVSIQTFAA